MKITVSRDEILDLEGSLKKEYLLTNGRGGYCSSSILDCHKRKYHGLLVLPVKKFDKKFIFLSKIEPVVSIGGKFMRLSTNKFPFVYEPQGHKYMESFEMERVPVTTYRMGDTEIVKSVLMPYGSETVLVRFDVRKSPKKVLLKLTPLLAYRDIHSLTRENMALRPRPYPEKNGFKVDPYEGLPPLFIQLSKKPDFFPAPLWYKDVEYIKELNRGYPYQEDLFSPGVFELNLKEGESVIVRASLEPMKKKPEEEWDAEVDLWNHLGQQHKQEPEPLRTLKLSSYHYIIDQQGITAGYHWFGEWGRDTMISLAGLTLCTGQKEVAFDILKKYAKFERYGLLPNFLSADGNHAYNSVDASLLYFRAVQQYLAYGGDREKAARELFPAMKDILSAWFVGKVPNCRLGEDGLVYAGNERSQLTWMDAQVDGRPVTPRHGAAVEINALWYNALRFMDKEFGAKLPKEFKALLKARLAAFEANFLKAFWNEDDQCLCDVYRGPADRDTAIRPNQLFATALPFPCVPRDEALKLIATVQSHLVTPFGLRTLSPGHPSYASDYRGPPASRDAAYHNGMIWPWLIGIFADSLLAFTAKEKARKTVLDTFSPLWTDHLKSYCLFHVSEIFKPNPPFTAKGCVAQAWSLAEIIRTLERVRE